MHGGPEHDEAAKRLEQAFIDGFRAAADKQAFLRLTGIPFDLGARGEPALKLVEVRIEEVWTVGAVSPGFGSVELAHHPLPAEMIKRGTRVVLEYVSQAERRTVPLGRLTEQD